MEPSEAMYTVAHGVVNAGAILLMVSILSVLVFGRWFCGWACHLVALQDGSAWLLKKIGIRPRPLRSRWLMIVPLLAGLHLFLFPLVARALLDQPAPELQTELQKEEFWETFPGFWVGLATFVVCGFLMVYLLGAKGFCTYACPYGGLFGVADRVAPGRIRVSDACKRCGHCSAVCTSNVVVHEEVHTFGMVVDPGCMKCLDCVSSCPEQALSFGFGKPSLGARPRKGRTRKTRTRPFSLREELSLAAIFVIALAIFAGVPEAITVWLSREFPGTFPNVEVRGLYGQTPLLFGLGLAATTAFVLVYLWRTLRRPDVGLQSWTLRKEGRLTRPGLIFRAAAIIWLAFCLHSAWHQVTMWRAQAARQKTFALQNAAYTQDLAALEQATPEQKAAIERGRELSRDLDRFGLFPDPHVPLCCVRGSRCAAARPRTASAFSVMPSPWPPRTSPFAKTWLVCWRSPAQRTTPARRSAFSKSRWRSTPKHIPTRLALAMLRAPFDAESSVQMLGGALLDAPEHQQMPQVMHRARAIATLLPQEARPMLEKVRQERPDDARAYVLLFEISVRLNDGPGAEKVACAMIDRWPEQASGYGFMAWAAEAQGRKDEAATWRQRAQRITGPQ